MLVGIISKTNFVFKILRAIIKMLAHLDKKIIQFRILSPVRSSGPKEGVLPVTVIHKVANEESMLVHGVNLTIHLLIQYRQLKFNNHNLFKTKTNYTLTVPILMDR